jgi:hypothetical protein
LTKGANISGFNNSSSIVRVSEAVRGENTSVLPFIRSETSNADSYQKLKNENTGVQVNYISWTVIYFRNIILKLLGLLDN